MPTFSHTLEWLALKGVIALVQRGDLAAAVAWTHRVSQVGRHLLRSEWAWSQANLRNIYGPALDAPSCRILAKQAFANIFTSYMEGLRAADVTIIDQEGGQRLLETFRLGRGMILCNIHLGSWEPLLRHGAALGLPLAVVYRHANNPLSEEIFCQIRSVYGIQWIRRDDVRSAVRVLREKRVLGLMTDINTRRGGILAPFLGLPAMCPSGPARLAMQFQCPIIPLVAVREQPGVARLLVGEPIEPLAGTADEATLAALTTRINQAFAPWIHEYAEQYNWLHARWSSRSDGSRVRADFPLAQERIEPFAPLSPRIRQLLGKPLP